MEGKRVVVPLASHFVCRQSFSFMGGHSRWQAAIFIRGRGVMFPGHLWSCPGRLSFVHQGRCCCVVFCSRGCCSWGHSLSLGTDGEGEAAVGSDEGWGKWWEMREGG